MDAPESPVAPAMEVVDENNEMELSSPGPEDIVAAAEAAAAEEPPIVIKSCTVWIGHLPKGISEGELKKVMAEYGAVSTLDLIPSRGCACKFYQPCFPSLYHQTWNPKFFHLKFKSKSNQIEFIK